MDGEEGKERVRENGGTSCVHDWVKGVEIPSHGLCFRSEVNSSSNHTSTSTTAAAAAKPTATPTMLCRRCLSHLGSLEQSSLVLLVLGHAGGMLERKDGRTRARQITHGGQDAHERQKGEERLHLYITYILVSNES